MRRLGIELSKQERRAHDAVKGDACVQYVQYEHMGRPTSQALIMPQMPMDDPPLPPLLDVRLSGMATRGFVLSGFEIIEGCAYAQSWWCRLE